MADEAWTTAHYAGDDAWRAIGGVKSLDRTELAALIELASWRHRAAVAGDVPLGRIAAERTLLELARARPLDARALRKVRGANELREREAEVISAVRAGVERARTGELPEIETVSGASTPRADLWTEIVLALVAQASESTGIAPRFLATRAEAESLCRAIDRAGAIDGLEHPLLTTWRREVVGDRIARWFRGETALGVDRTGPVGITVR